MKYNTVLPLAQGTFRFANVTIYIRRDGKIVVRQRYNDAGKGIVTPERLAGWVRWANVLNQYKVMAGLMRSMFPDREHFRSAFGEFMSLNYRQAEVCLTKWDARLGAVVFQPGLIVSMGSNLELPSIEVTLQGDKLVSDIRVAADFEVTAETTISELTSQVVSHNRLTFSEGDTLFFLRCTQSYNDVLDIPSGTARWYRCDLNLKDTRKLAEVVGTDGFQTTLRDGARLLSAYADQDSMGAWLHGHKRQDGRWITSLQTLVGRNSLYADYTSAEAEKKAGDSYGGANRFNYLNSKTQVLTYSEIEGDGEVSGGGNNGSGSTGGTTPGGGSGTGTGSDPTNPGQGGSTGGSTGGGSTPGKVQVTVTGNMTDGVEYLGSGEYTPGEQVQIQARVQSGSGLVFDRWNDGSTQNPRTITVPDQDTTYTAQLSISMRK